MLRHTKYRPYVRRYRPGDKTENFAIAFRMAFYLEQGRPFYVMVQRGFPRLVIEVGASKRDVQRKPVLVKFGRSTFRQWAKRIQCQAMGVPA